MPVKPFHTQAAEIILIFLPFRRNKKRQLCFPKFKIQIAHICNF